MAAAEKKIYVTSPYFLPHPSLREILIRKAKEGVDVRILVPNKLNDSWAVHHASRNSYDELLAGRVQIFEYQPTFIHAKSIVIDNSWSIIGSANMDNRSRKLNEEAVFGILTRISARSWKVYFSPTLPRRSNNGEKEIFGTELKNSSLGISLNNTRSDSGPTIRSLNPANQQRVMRQTGGNG